MASVRRLIARSAALIAMTGLLFALISAPVRALDALAGAELTAALAEGDSVRASKLLIDALAEATRPEDREDVLSMLAEVMLDAGDAEQAAVTLLELADSFSRRLGQNAPERASTLERAGDAFWLAGRPAEAFAAHVEALRIDVRRGTAIADSPLHARLKQRVAEISDPAQRTELEAELAALSTPSQRIATTRRVGPSLSAGGSAIRTPISPGGDNDNLANVSSDNAPPYSTVRIYYATDRARSPSPTRPDDVYGGGRGDALDYGTADVSVPLVHRPGALEAPTIWTFDAADPERHIILSSVRPAAREEVYRQMHNHLELTGSDEAFVFVHGFNVTFADAAKRTAQLAYDMNFDGLPILYSWPSAGNLFSYLPDSAVVQLSGRRLSGFLDEVVRDTGAKRIHLVAHSMGNRALIEALELYALRHAGEPPAFDQALFTAPDIDAGLFAAMAETIRPAVNRMTLYTSRKDWALLASRKLHGDAPRAGEGGPGTPIPAWVDSIDMSTLGDDMLAHSYFADDASALSDILTLFWRDTPPDRRCGIEQGTPTETAAHWRYEPEACDGSAMLSALAQMRSRQIGSISEALALIEEKFLPPDVEPERKRKLESAVAALLGR